jgi:hypothetical protein
MLYAYCDESFSSDLKTTPIYVVAGFLGDREQWTLFEELWRESMRDLDITEIGCHTAKCAYGGKGYEHMSSPKRKEIQTRLMVDIIASKLFGVVAIIDMAGYREFRSRFSALLAPKDRQYNEPHVLAARHCVQQMCLETREATNEPISFVFDRNESFGSRAEDWYKMESRHKESWYHSRLGPFVHEDRMKAVGLQAADMLAYAAFRHFSHRSDWHWRELTGARRIGEPMITGAEFYRGIVEQLEEKNAQNVASKSEV